MKYLELVATFGVALSVGCSLIAVYRNWMDHALYCILCAILLQIALR
jgi:hypothetical protein